MNLECLSLLNLKIKDTRSILVNESNLWQQMKVIYPYHFAIVAVNVNNVEMLPIKVDDWLQYLPHA